MSQSRLESSFEAGAVKFDVAESDYLVMKHEGVSCYEKLFYRFPTREDLEKFMENVLHSRAAYRDSGGEIRVYNKRNPDWNVWKSSDDAACLRKMWAFGSALCKSEIDDMTSGAGTGEKIKITPAAASELERKACRAGMPKAVSDSERPSTWTLQRVANNFSLGGRHAHLEWENFVSIEVEERVSRSGKQIKSRPAVFLVGGKNLEVQDQEVELEGCQKVTGLVSMREVLQLRSRSFAMLELTTYDLMQKLHERYHGLMRQTAPDKMRTPTINEVRRFDRELMKQALKFKSEGQGEIGHCLEYYLDNPNSGLWKLLDVVPENLPDQGQEKTSKERPAGDDRDPSGKGHKRPHEGEKDDDKDAPPLKMCLVCKKRHYPFCTMPDGFRREMRAKEKARKKAKGRGKGDKANPSKKDSEGAS